jgi:hypothetical protein
MRKGKGFFLNSTGLTSAPPQEILTHPENFRQDHRFETSVWPDDRTFNFEIGDNERGIILSNPLRISGTSVSIESTSLDPSELRRALLFWDLLAWPASNGIYIAGGPDEEFLISENRLVRPKFNMNGDAATGLSMAFIETLKLFEQRQPGQWMMSNGKMSLNLNGKGIQTKRGVLATLSNLIPVPMHDVPLEDVLRFRDERLPEVLALRSALDRLYQDWVNSEDQDHQLRMAIRDLDEASADMIRVARENHNPFALSSWKMSFNFSASDVFAKFLGGTVIGLDTASSLLISAASTVTFRKDVGLKIAKGNSPFSYIASVHKELF